MEGTSHGSEVQTTKRPPHWCPAPGTRQRAHTFRSFSDLSLVTQKLSLRPPGDRWRSICRLGHFPTHVWPQKEPVKCRKVEGGHVGESVVLLRVLFTRLWGPVAPRGAWPCQMGQRACVALLPVSASQAVQHLLACLSCLGGATGIPHHPKTEWG